MSAPKSWWLAPASLCRRSQTYSASASAKDVMVRQFRGEACSDRSFANPNTRQTRQTCSVNSCCVDSARGRMNPTRQSSISMMPPFPQQNTLIHKHKDVRCVGRDISRHLSQVACNYIRSCGNTFFERCAERVNFNDSKSLTVAWLCPVQYAWSLLLVQLSH